MPFWFRGMSLVPFFIFSWLLLDRFSELHSNYRKVFISGALGAALLVILTAILGQLTHQVPSALWLGAGFASLASLVVAIIKTPEKKTTWSLQWSTHLILFILICLVISLLVVSICLRFSFHDQTPVQAHPALIESMLRGNFPPSLMVFPDIPLKYHYGADLFGAVMSYITGLPAYRAVDITQIFGWVATMACLYCFCREIGLNLFYSLAAQLWTLLATGWAYLLGPWLIGPQAMKRYSFAWTGSHIVFHRHLNPGTVNNFFMTPYSLGMPLFFAYLSLLAHWYKIRKSPLLFIAALILAATSLIQVTFFLTLLATTLAIFLTEVLIKQRSWRNFLIPASILLGTALPLAFLLGGFFVRSKGYESGLLHFNWPLGYLKNALYGLGHPIDAKQAFLWYLSTFGSLVFLSFPFIFLAILYLKKSYNPLLLFLLYYASGCFLIAQCFRYQLSWDIIKWFTGFHLTMPILIIVLWSKFEKRRILISILIGVCLALDILPSLRYLGALGLLQDKDVHPVNRGWFSTVIKKPSEDIKPILNALRAGAWDEGLLTSKAMSPIFARYAGQSIAIPDTNTVAFGVKRKILRERTQLLKHLTQTFDLDEMKNSSIRWIVFNCQEFEKTFSERSKLSIEQLVIDKELSDLSNAFSDECWKIYYLEK